MPKSGALAELVLLIPLWLGVTTADAAGLGPSFDCHIAQDPLAQVICSDATLSRKDLEFVQAYQALRQQLGDAGAATLRQQAAEFHASVLQQCGISADHPASPENIRCVDQAYRKQRFAWLARLTGAAAEEANRPLEQHLALQAKLQQLGFLPSDATLDGVYGNATRAAITGWQQSLSLTLTGLLGDADARALQEAAAAAVPQRTNAPFKPKPAATEATEGSMTFAMVSSGGNCHRCEWIRADGIITDKSPEDFASFIRAYADELKRSGEQQSWNGDYADVVLNSPGGNLNAALELGRAFRQHHVFTEIASSVQDPGEQTGSSIGYSINPGICLSACFFAFVGGERRSMIANHGDEVDQNRLGIHRFSEATPDQSLTAAQRMAGAQAAYLSEMGVDSKILAVAAAVPATSMRDLTTAEAANYHIITENLPPPRWTIERAGVGLSLNVAGKAQNEESMEQFDYSISLGCPKGGRTKAVMSVKLRSSSIKGAWAEQTPGICETQAVGFEWRSEGRHYGAYASNCLQDLQWASYADEIVRRRTDLTLRGGKSAGGELPFYLVLGADALSLLDKVQQIWLVIIPADHADNWLPDRIDLPWEQRENVSALLGRNCAN